MDINRLLTEFKEKWLAKAEVYVKNPEKIRELIPKISEYVLKDGLAEVKERVLLVVDYFRDIASGRYKDYNTKSLLVLVAAMIYLISPIDFIPDLIPLLGLTDDATLIVFVVREFSSELEKYRIWKNR